MIGLTQQQRNHHHHHAAAAIDTLPAEIIDQILELVYIDGGRQPTALLPVSRVNRALRKPSLAILCREVLCVLRETEVDVDASLLPSPDRDRDVEHLLHYGKTLCVRLVTEPLPKAGLSDEQLQAIRARGKQTLEYYISRMPQLQLVRAECSLASGTDLLTILKDRVDVPVHFIHLTWLPLPSSSKSLELKAEFTQLLEPRWSIALGRFTIVHGGGSAGGQIGGRYRTGASCGLASFASTPHVRDIQAMSLYIPPSDQSRCADSAMSNLEEVWIRKGGMVDGLPAGSLNSVWPEAPWSKIRRLYVPDVLVPTLNLDRGDSGLRSLRHLHLVGELFTLFHNGCPFEGDRYSRWHAISKGDFFQLDFTTLPQLESLTIEGMCGHVPIANVIGPRLRSVRLHRSYQAYASAGCGGVFGQRTPADVVEMARIAPEIENLALDIGPIKNLWHPTAIPGVDVDPKLYSLLAALARFRRLRTLTLFPAHLDPDCSSSARTGTSEAGVGRAHSHSFALCSDIQAIHLFNHVRQQNGRLSTLVISPGLLETTFPDGPIARAWQVRAWGEKTVLVTRKMGDDYELRQVWIGERKLSSEVKRDGFQRGLGLRVRERERDYDWILQSSPRM